VYDNKGVSVTYLELWDGDQAADSLRFWADKNELKKKCKINHAWARTIHTFQVLG